MFGLQKDRFFREMQAISCISFASVNIELSFQRLQVV